MTGGKVNIAHNAVGRLTLMGEKFKAVPLPGVFSVSATKKVRFSQGNLYYNGSKFDFEANQYEYHGYDSWGLFGWVGASSTAFTSSPEIYGVSTSTTLEDYGNSATDALKADWGTAIDDKGTWSTLSKAEWQYLLKTDTPNRMVNGKPCYSNAVSSGVTIGGATYKGVFLYPDDYSGKEVVDNTETWTWDKINSAGIVFLPAALRRDGSTVESFVSGSYWSSTAYDGEWAYYLYFNNATVSPGAQFGRYEGFSVRLVTDASVTPAPTPTTTGTAKATIGGSEVDVNWVQLWEDGPKFAEYNVGVTDGKAESYGGYYCWGKAIDKDSSGSYKDGESALSGDDDTATNLWGSNWRMPTKAELEALLSNCNVAWTTVNDKNGRKFTGKGAYASNSVFLPAAGYCFLYGEVGYQGSGRYWSSTPYGSDIAYFLNFDSDSQDVSGTFFRSSGCSVRAVLAE
ncbi:MAG: DUF1566 domain-containing protein [Bacteroidaceae bacterium]|nr:DUF1566 domain-containing protein [Bacteroidaceae bacterium]